MSLTALLYLWHDVFDPRFLFFGSIRHHRSLYPFYGDRHAGRVWCGYACPQTIWTHLYQHVEKWVIGDRNKRIKFDKEPMSAKKAFKRALVYFIWFAFSVITAATFVMSRH